MPPAASATDIEWRAHNLVAEQQGAKSRLWMQTAGLTTTSSGSGQAIEARLGHEVALAVARLVAFRIDPMRVVAGGSHI